MKVPLGLLIILSVHLVQSLKPPDYNVDIDKGRQGSYPVQKFVSSDLQEPIANFRRWRSECDDGLYYFIAPRGHEVPSPGPMILDGAGTLIWSNHFANKFGGQAYDLKVQKYKGDDYLTFWLGDDRVRGHGKGSYYMLNSSYDVVYEVNAADGLRADLHDFVITPEGTALLMVYKPTLADVRPFGRKFSDLWNQAIYDCVFQEVDIETGKLIFDWRASEHLNLTLTYNKLASKMGDSGTKTNPFDWFHGNSIDKDEFGNYLVSTRNLHAVFYIDGRTKEVIWTLGGKSNNFQDLSNGHALNFAWQHDARFVPVNAFPETYTAPPARNGFTTRLVMIFDNAAMDWNYDYGPFYSRALLLELTYPNPGTEIHQRSMMERSHTLTSRAAWSKKLNEHDSEKIATINGTDPSYTVRAVHEYINPENVISSTQGSVQLLSQQGYGKDPRILVGYGINAVVTEFNSDGSVLCDMHFGAARSWETGDVQSYRAFKSPWVGRPRQKPAAALQKNHVYASWNGSTECREWVLQVLENTQDLNNQDWKEIARVPKTRFETALPLDTKSYDLSKTHLRVVAIGKDGQPCENGISDPIRQGRFASLKIGNMGSGYQNPIILIIFCVVSGYVLVRIFRSFIHRRPVKNKNSFATRERID